MANSNPIQCDRRSFLWAFPGLVTLAGCVVVGGTPGGPPVPAPVYRVGDRWVYNGSDGFRVQARWDETHEVIAIDSAGIRILVTQTSSTNATLNMRREELLAAPGLVKIGAVFDVETRRFDPPLERFRFPLTTGESWNQRANNFNESTQQQGQISYAMTIGGFDKIATPAGDFDAIRMRLIMRLDDEDPFRFATECNYLQWFAPAVGALIRIERTAQYIMKGSPGLASIVRSQNSIIQLASFTPGRR